MALCGFASPRAFGTARRASANRHEIFAKLSRGPKLGCAQQPLRSLSGASRHAGRLEFVRPSETGMQFWRSQWKGAKSTILDTFEESRKALERAGVLAFNREELLGPEPLEQLAAAIARCGWTLVRRHQNGDECVLDVNVEERNYRLQWCGCAARRFIFGCAYRMPEATEELAMRRRAANVDERVWFSKTVVSLDPMPSIRFTIEMSLQDDLKVQLEEARSIVDDAARYYFLGCPP